MNRTVTTWANATPAEREILFGDTSIDRVKQTADYEQMLIDRFTAGMPLTKDAAKRVRRLLKERSQK